MTSASSAAISDVTTLTCAARATSCKVRTRRNHSSVAPSHGAGNARERLNAPTIVMMAGVRMNR